MGSKKYACAYHKYETDEEVCWKQHLASHPIITDNIFPNLMRQEVFPTNGSLHQDTVSWTHVDVMKQPIVCPVCKGYAELGAAHTCIPQEDKAVMGVKLDSGKLGWHLLPYDAVCAIIRVIDFGAKKYAARNWELGMDWSRMHSAAMRHMSAWWQREEGDPDTGFSHLWHAGCCILFLIAYELRGKGKDDRPDANGPN